MLKINLDYCIKDDINFILESERIGINELSDRTGISRMTLDRILSGKVANYDVCEKFYSFLYEHNYRINSVKEELIKEKYSEVLFHGSKNGLSNISIFSSRENCDFGKGFYLGETYSQALAFVSEKNKSSIYSFKYKFDNLKKIEFDCDLDWMLAICFYRGGLKDYTQNEKVRKIIDKIEKADIVVAPIADNRMFYIMSQFSDGEINAEVALHSLSASKLGKQHVFKSEESLNNLVPIEKYFVSIPERIDCRKALNERSYEIDTKLKLAKREFKNGLYIEELLK